MAFLFRNVFAVSLCVLASGFPSPNVKVNGRFDPFFRFGRRPQISVPARSSSLSAQRGIQPMPAYLIAGIAPRKSKSKPESTHEVNIIRQTLVVNKNRNVLPSGQKRKPSPKTPGHGSTRVGPVATRPQPSWGVQRGSLASLPNGIHILPNLQWLRKGSVRQALKRQNIRLPQNSQSKKRNSQVNHPSAKLNAHNPSAIKNNPTNIIIYRKGQSQPIIIRTHGKITLSKSNTADGNSNIIILKSPSNTRTSTLKPGEDPPEVENEVANQAVR